MKDQLSTDMKIAIEDGAPIQKYGLTFFPITMRHYEKFMHCKSVLLLRQSTLPAAYAGMSFLSAVYALEMESIRKTGAPTGMMNRLCTLMCMALKIPEEEIGERFRFRMDENNPESLLDIRIAQGQAEAVVMPAQFNVIRRILAAQNGEELPDEAENAELIQAEYDMQTAENDFAYDPETVIASVAHSMHRCTKEIRDWTIREFELQKDAHNRALYFVVNAIAEGYGAKWKHGNPYPSWHTERKRRNAALLDARQWESGLGGAIQKTDRLPNR